MNMEKSSFVEYFGEYPWIKVWDFFLSYRDFDYSLTDIAENAGIGWATANRIFPKFVRMKIVIKTRQIGRAKLYKLNEKNPIVKKMIEVYNTVGKTAIENEMEKQKIKI